LALLYGTHVENDLFPRYGHLWPHPVGAVMHHVKARAIHSEQLLHLASREFGNGDDGIRCRGGLSCLQGETPAELRSGIVAGKHEEIVKSRNRLAELYAG